MKFIVRGCIREREKEREREKKRERGKKGRKKERIIIRIGRISII